MPTKKPIFHVFTHLQDDWLPEKEAIKLYSKWKKEIGSVRLYSTEWNSVDGVWDDIDCLRTYGEFPL